MHSSLKEGRNTISLVTIHRKQFSLSTVDSSCELYTTQPAWQSALAKLKPSASLDSGLLWASLCGFSECGGGSLTAVRSSALSEIWPLATGWISPLSALLPLVSELSSCFSQPCA